MIKLFRKLAANCVIMTVDYDTVNPDVVHVLFLYRNASYRMNRAINLSEFTDVWGGDHVLENVLEAYLDEFLAEIGKPNLERTVKFSDRQATDGGE